MAMSHCTEGNAVGVVSVVDIVGVVGVVGATPGFRICVLDLGHQT